MMIKQIMGNFLLREIDKLLPWSLIGLLVSIILGVPGFYYTFHEKKPNISFQINAESNILDIHKPIKDLDISFRNTNLQTSKQNLKFYIITIKNIGDKNLLQSDFDQNKVWGLNFKNSQIIETPNIIDSNSEYLKENINPIVINENTIELSKIIFEKDKYVSLEIKILHSNDKQPIITPIGKIAGIDELKIENYQSPENKDTFLKQLLYGSIVVHAVRLPIYVIIFIFILFSGEMIVRAISSWKGRLLRLKVNKLLEPIMLKVDEDGKKLIYSFFYTFPGDIKDMEECLSILDSDENIKKIEEMIKKRNIEHKEFESINRYGERYIEMYTYHQVLQDKILDINGDGKIAVNYENVNLIKTAINLLKSDPKIYNNKSRRLLLKQE